MGFVVLLENIYCCNCNSECKGHTYFWEPGDVADCEKCTDNMVSNLFNGVCCHWRICGMRIDLFMLGMKPYYSNKVTLSSVAAQRRGNTFCILMKAYKKAK